MENYKKIKLCKNILALSTCFVIGTLAGALQDHLSEDKEEITIENNDENLVQASSEEDLSYETITKEEAESLGILTKNPSKAKLLIAVNNNEEITEEYNLKDYFTTYIDALYGKYPDINTSIFLKNIELLKVNYYTKDEINEIMNNEYTEAFFDSYNHTLNLCTELVIEDNIYHELGHLLRSLDYTENNKHVKSSFRSYYYGTALDEEINTAFTNTILHNKNGYQVNNVYLLEQLIEEDELYDIYLNKDVYALEDKLTEINPDISAEDFIIDHDIQNDYYFDKDQTNNYNIDVKLYDMYIDYFISKKAEQDYLNMEEDSQEFKNIFYNIVTDYKNREKIFNDWESIVETKILVK